MTRATVDWEHELWFYVTKGDGITCPIRDNCGVRDQDGRWISGHETYFDQTYAFPDNGKFASNS